jgi:hypothetical protein
VNLVNGIESNEQVTREELDTLWWAFNGVSTRTETAFAELPVGLAALDSAKELAGLVLMPPLPNTPFLLKRVLKEGRPPKDLEDQSLKDLMAQWDKEAAAHFLDTDTAAFVQGNPAVFPISWVCGRVAEGGSYVSDMKKMTGWDPAEKVGPNRLAFQCFQEKIAQQLYQNVTE